MARLGASVSGLIYLIVGAGTTVLGIVLVLLYFPCISGSGLCLDIQQRILYDVLFGQIPAYYVPTFQWLFPISFLFIGITLLFFASLQLGFALRRHPSSTIELSVGFNTLVLILIVALNMGLAWIGPDWLARFEQSLPLSASVDTQTDDTTSTVEALNVNREQKLQQIAFYSQLQNNVQLFSHAMALFLIAATGFMLTNPYTPPKDLMNRYLNKSDLQCQQCGLLGIEEKSVCILCQLYFNLEIRGRATDIAPIPMVDLRTPCVLDCQVKPALRSSAKVPIRNLMLEVTYPRLLDCTLNLPGREQDWKLDTIQRAHGRFGLALVKAPDYLVEDTEFELIFKPKPQELVRQRPRRKQYIINVQARSAYGGAPQPIVLKLDVKREKNRWEHQSEHIRNATSIAFTKGVRTSRKAANTSLNFAKQMIQGIMHKAASGDDADVS